MTSPVSPSETIAKAMEGVTHAPGVWEADGTVVYCDDKTGQRVASTRGEYLLWTEEQKRAIAAYIAACNPVAMREVLDELYALRETALQLEAMERETAEKDERIADLGLGLLSASAQLAKVHDDAFKQAAGYGLVTTDGRDFSCLELNRCETEARRARTLIQGEKK